MKERFARFAMISKKMPEQVLSREVGMKSIEDDLDRVDERSCLLHQVRQKERKRRESDAIENRI